MKGAIYYESVNYIRMKNANGVEARRGTIFGRSCVPPGSGMRREGRRVGGRDSGWKESME